MWASIQSQQATVDICKAMAGLMLFKTSCKGNTAEIDGLVLRMLEQATGSHQMQPSDPQTHNMHSSDAQTHRVPIRWPLLEMSGPMT